MPTNDNMFVLNDLGSLRSKELKSGKVKYWIKMSAESVIINLDDKAIAAGIAGAIAKHLRDKVEAISATVTDATKRARVEYAKMFTAGKPSAVKRYTSRKLGPRAPNQSDKAFNDSGTFAKSISASISKGIARVNVAANRLTGDPAMVQRIYGRLLELVPEFGNLELLMQSNDILRRRVEIMGGIVQKGAMSDKGLGVGDLIKLAKVVVDLAGEIDGLAAA